MSISNEQYDTIMRDYQRRRLANLQEQERRRNEIRERLPEYMELDAQIASAGTSYAREFLNNGSVKETIRDLDGRIRELSEKKKAVLAANGFPEDYLELPFQCPDCHDTGYIGAEKCHCFRRAIVQLLYQESHILEEGNRGRFSDFRTDYYPDNDPDPATGLTSRGLAVRALNECRNFTEQFDRQYQNLFLYGNTGLGKTFLSGCIARELIETAHFVLYFSSFRLFEQLAADRFKREDAESRPVIAEQIYDCDLLIIDDLGTEMTNSFVSSELFVVLNERAMRKKSTVISTNLSLSVFAETYSERIFSRILSGYQMLKLTGEDIRLRKKFS